MLFGHESPLNPVLLSPGSFIEIGINPLSRIYWECIKGIGLPVSHRYPGSLTLSLQDSPKLLRAFISIIAIWSYPRIAIAVRIILAVSHRMEMGLLYLPCNLSSESSVNFLLNTCIDHPATAVLVGTEKWKPIGTSPCTYVPVTTYLQSRHPKYALGQNTLIPTSLNCYHPS